MRIIGLCGRSGSGKSTVAACLASLGCEIIDADAAGRYVMRRGSECVSELAERFGTGILRSDGSLDRRSLAAASMKDAEGVAALNAVTHKYILAEISARIAASDAEYTVIDAPLLFETGLDRQCAAVIGVIADDAICASRAASRDGIDEKSVARRHANQKSNEFLLSHCSHIIKNNGSLDELSDNVRSVFGRIRAELA